MPASKRLWPRQPTLATASPVPHSPASGSLKASTPQVRAGASIACKSCRSTRKLLQNRAGGRKGRRCNGTPHGVGRAEMQRAPASLACAAGKPQYSVAWQPPCKPLAGPLHSQQRWQRLRTTRARALAKDGSVPTASSTASAPVPQKGGRVAGSAGLYILMVEAPHFLDGQALQPDQEQRVWGEGGRRAARGAKPAACWRRRRRRFLVLQNHRARVPLSHYRPRAPGKARR